jgi:hypothetical protein
MRKPDEPGAAAFAIFNIAYGLALVAILIWYPSVPSWGRGWLLPVLWPVTALFLAINVGGVIWSW